MPTYSNQMNMDQLDSINMQALHYLQHLHQSLVLKLFKMPQLCLAPGEAETQLQPGPALNLVERIARARGVIKVTYVVLCNLFIFS